jgi:uncharacterized protein DUF2784
MSMSLFYRIAADLVVVFHMVYVLIVVLGLPAIWWGIARKHNWIRNIWLRGGHLAMIVIVVAEAWAGITCPLTIWEQQLRDAAGQQSYRGAFLANLVHDLLFSEAEPWVFTVIYSAFGLLVVGSFVMAPPRWPSRLKRTEKEVTESR